MYKIEFKKEECMGCGACTTCDNWEIGDNGLAFPKETKLEEIGCNQNVADIIKIIKEDH